jgi:hypothetical protein
MTATRQAVNHIRESQRFESMYTLQGKPDTHGMYASCASPCTPLVRFLWATLVRGNLSLVINIVGQSHCSQEKRDSQLHPQHAS